MVKKLCVLAAVAVLLYSTGCARNRQVHQFEPIPEPEVGAQELTPVQPPSTTDLLNRANEAFQRANKAQEEGNAKAVQVFTRAKLAESVHAERYLADLHDAAEVEAAALAETVTV